MLSCACGSCRPVNLAKNVNGNFVPSRLTLFDTARVRYYGDGGRSMGSVARGVRASMVDSSESSSNFIKRMEQAWLISQQPTPIACSTCNSNGHVECKWCGGTGFFMIGDNMLCQVHSRNSNCVICAGKGSMCCSDCKGTGFRAKWLGEPPIHK
ncbi:hypothetical protein NE237_024988 [Protea cynaroides]|uniref:Uncharacterized protein n=1 Tax=Protea cynaroides TaxID=273540 RepID=A0A9Q0H131_9MAGN|nr:hypothetical protein NE237_024988 [Protea cynaroides]